MAEPASRPRLLLLLPSTTYRATAFVEAARRLDLELTVATDQASVFAAREPDRLTTFDFARPERAAEQARAFAARHPVSAVVGVDDDSAVVAAAIAAALGLPHNPVEAALAARDKHRQRMLHSQHGVPVPEARALGLVAGPIHAELRFPGRPWLIELAARPIGGRCSRVLRFGAGSDPMSLEELLLRQAAGLPVPTYERESQPVGVMMIPTPRAGLLRAVRGVEAALAVPGVDGIELTAHLGQRLVPLPAGSQYPGFIFARAESAGAVEAALRRAHACLSFDIEPE